MRRSSRGVIDQSEQQVFSSHVIVVEPLGLLACKRQDLLGTWSKIIHHCVSDAGPARLDLLKVDTTPALRYLPSKVKKIEYYGERQQPAGPAGFGRSDLLRLRLRRRWIVGLELAEFLFFLLGLLFNFSLPLFELIVWFCQFVLLLQG